MIEETSETLGVNAEEDVVAEPEVEVPSELEEEDEVIIPIHETADGEVVEHLTEEE